MIVFLTIMVILLTISNLYTWGCIAYMNRFLMKLKEICNEEIK